MGRELKGEVSLITGAGFGFGFGFGFGCKMPRSSHARELSLILAYRDTKTAGSVTTKVKAAEDPVRVCRIASDLASCFNGAAFVADSGHTAG